MKYLFVTLTILIIGCSKPKAENQEQNNLTHTRYQDSTQAVTTVDVFFKAFHDKDVQKITLLLPATMKIIHHNGVETDTSEMVKVIDNTKNWWPRTRKLSNFEFITDNKISIPGLTNEVTFSLPDNKTVYERYNESWIFEKTDSILRPIRCHYSKVTVDKHSEVVN